MVGRTVKTQPVFFKISSENRQKRFIPAEPVNWYRIIAMGTSGPAPEYPART